MLCMFVHCSRFLSDHLEDFNLSGRILVKHALSVGRVAVGSKSGVGCRAGVGAQPRMREDLDSKLPVFPTELSQSSTSPTKTPMEASLASLHSSLPSADLAQIDGGGCDDSAARVEETVARCMALALMLWQCGRGVDGLRPSEVRRALSTALQQLEPAALRLGPWIGTDSRRSCASAGHTVPSHAPDCDESAPTESLVCSDEYGLMQCACSTERTANFRKERLASEASALSLEIELRQVTATSKLLVAEVAASAAFLENEILGDLPLSSPL